eukprot:25314-Eustigmatos_ZCMA.PRE.1
MNRRLRPLMYWPVDQFDEHGAQDMWTWARKGNAVAAYCIRGSRVTVVVRDLAVSSVARCV